MSLLTRTPREAYRVHTQEEFLSDAGWERTLSAPAQSAGTGGRFGRRRLVVATALAAAMGTAGGLSAIALTSPPTTRRRSAARALQLRRPAVSAPAWRPAGRSDRPPSKTASTRSPHPTRVLAHQLVRRLSAGRMPARTLGRRGGVGSSRRPAVAVGRGAPGPAHRAGTVVSVEATSSGAGPSEFGFEH
jgi:hypothetical protein